MNTEFGHANDPLEDPAQPLTTNPPAALDMNTETPGTLLNLQNSGQPLANEEWREQLDKVLRFLLKFPEYFDNNLGEYRKPLTTVGVILGAGLGIAVADGVLTRLNTIPLFAPTFELIGLGFTGWIVFRYLLYADTRQELLQEYDKVKDRIIGKD
jgi:glutamyl-tRNA synthetase